MIEGIREIGEYALKKEEKRIDDPLRILVDNPESNPLKPTYKNVMLILVDRIGSDYQYKGIDIERFSSEKVLLYLYKQGSRNGPDVTPTARITRIKPEGNKKTTFEIKILSWFKNYKSADEFLGKISKCIEQNKQLIQNDLEKKYEDINKKENSIITLKIDGRYIGEYKIIKQILLEESIRGFYSKYGKESKSNNLCSVCKQRKEVYGFVDTYKFYTVDKPGFVSGGFQQRYAWKNYPVCLTCALILEEGRKYIGNSLNFNFYGFRYLLIPKFVKGVNDELKNKIFKIIEGQKDPKFTKREIARLTSDEFEILRLMSEQENYLNMNFLFYYAPKGYDGSVFNILLYIEDILPSRLKRLFDVKKEIDGIEIFRRCMVPVFENGKKTGEEPLRFNFGVLRTFLSKISDNQTYNKYFLDIVGKIFSAKSLNYHFIMSFIVKKIREDFIDGYPINISTLKGFMLLNYLNRLGLLKNFKEVKMMDETTIINISGEIKEKIDAFFYEHADFFNTPAKKAVFLEGVLVQKLLNIQRLSEVSNAQPGREPFRHRLKGLKLDEKQIKKLLPEIQNKLEEYGKNYYRDLEKIISGYFVSVGNNWKMTNDEISYYFVLGMNLSDLFKQKKEDENE